jgi:hypothetical protein
MIRSIFLLILAVTIALSPRPASAARKEIFRQAACPEPAWLAKRIRICSQNRFAAEAAARCQAEMDRDWTRVYKLFRKLLGQAEARQTENQNRSMVDSRDGYYETYLEMSRQVEQMQKYTTRIASYAQVMLDFPDSRSAKTSASCFNSAFDQVQEIVSGMDKKIIEAMKARDEAKQLVVSTHGRHENFENTPGTAEAARTVQQVRPQAPPRPANKTRTIIRSGISGPEDKKKP